MKNLLPLTRASMRDLLIGTVVGAVLCSAVLSTSIVDWTWMKLFGEGTAFVPGAQLDFTATAYCKGTTTASGVAVRRGIAAADPQLLPVGSVVSLSTGVPAFDGVYTVLDTGPAVQGRRLDLYVWSCYEALDFGRRRVQATILRLDWDPRASQPSGVDRLFRRREARRTPRRQAPPAPAGERAPTAGTTDPAAPDAAPPAPSDGAGAEHPRDATAPPGPASLPETQPAPGAPDQRSE